MIEKKIDLSHNFETKKERKTESVFLLFLKQQACAIFLAPLSSFFIIKKNSDSNLTTNFFSITGLSDLDYS